MEILIDTHIHDIEINITAIFFGRFFQVILIFRTITVDKNMEMKSYIFIRFQNRRDFSA